jgi:glycosyltransferase involved in cell wall biosynthesis
MRNVLDNANKCMRIMVLGLRGIPNVEGGVETHAQHLYPRLSNLGCEVEVIVRSPYVAAGQRSTGSIRLRRLWAPKKQGLEALIHSFLGVLYAAVVRPDVLHLHAVGPAYVAPIARLFGLKVVVTHHGPDYERDKWGPFARWFLRLGESVGMRYANARIVISRGIAERMRAKYGVHSYIIRNGVIAGVRQHDEQSVRQLGLEPRRYFLHVSRMVPEKRHLDLIAAFAAAAVPGWKLALVGACGTDEYSRKVREAAAQTPGVVLTGFQKGAALQALYSHAGVFVLPSAHEGLPIAMLEALSYGLPVLASDIPANLEIGLESSCYFPCGDRAALAQALRAMGETAHDPTALAARRTLTLATYDWDRIADQTFAVYREVSAQGGAGIGAIATSQHRRTHQD